MEFTLNTKTKKKKKHLKPKLERLNAVKNIDYEPPTTTTSTHTLSSSSSPSSSLEHQSSFRVTGIDGEFDRIFQSLGLSGPEDFAIPTSDWVARKARFSASSNASNNKVKEQDQVEVQVSAELRNGVVKNENFLIPFRGEDSNLDFSSDSKVLGSENVDGVVVGGGGRGIKGVRPPLLIGSTLDLNFMGNFATRDDGGVGIGVVDSLCSSGEHDVGRVRHGERSMLFSDSSSFTTSHDDDSDVGGDRGCSCSGSGVVDELVHNVSRNVWLRRTFFSWQKGDVLGKGSFGTVYEGYTDDGFFFAVKEVSLLDEGNHGKQSIFQLQQEISLLSQFEHENIVRYFGTDKAGLSSKAFVLIQGPPGTGKTQTILGLLSSILHATPTRVHSKSRIFELKRGPQLPIEEKYKHWGLASPWLNSINPRDSLMPKDGDDGFFPTTGNELKPEAVTSSRKYRVRVLVCAPSNSALDEIVLRVLNGGIHDENDRSYCPKIVRIGLKAHHSIKSVVLDELVKQKRATANKSSTDKQSNGPTGSNDDSVRAAILEEATIVFSTLSFSGSHIFSKLSRSFDVVIIDEAAQAVEPATLVPLANQCKKVFLVGDPAQLPATVISDVAKNHGYGTSLFERLKQAGYPVKMLKTQYRMHPEIRSFPSREFYEDSLEDGADVKLRTERAWHRYRCFGPFCFFDIHEGKEARPSGSGGSWINVEEVDFVLFLYQKLVTLYPTLKSGNQVAIISPYSQQVKLFQRRFEETFGVSAEKVVDICTVDGCQGREKDVAIFSCVRASKDKGIGFVEDIRRMNVGITRAKSAVLVVGSASTLRRSEQWNKLVESAEKRECLFKASQPYSSFFSDASLASMQAKMDGPSQLTGPADEANDVPTYNAAADADQAPAENNDYGDGEADMDNAGFDED